MHFANPWILAALPLGLIPIVIYYLLRYRTLSVTWGANYVLERALEQMKGKVNVDQAILMALRVLAVVAIVIAFARPLLNQASATVAGSGIHHVLIVDGSYSMLAGPEGHRRWDAAMESMHKLVATWGRGETWSVLFLADQPRWVVDGQAIENPLEARAKLDALHPGESAASVSTALTLVAQKFPRGKVDLFVFADDQASTWADAELTRFPAELAVHLYWINASGQVEAKPNLAVTALAALADRVLIENPCRVRASVKNYSTVKVEDVNVELLVDGAFAARRSISLLPNQESALHFDVKFAEAGSHYLSVQLPEDALDFDNRLFAAVEVAPKLTVMELRDAGRSGKFDSSWGSFETLERTRQMEIKAGGSDAAKGQIEWKLNEGPVDAATLEGVDAVLLDGGRKITPELVGRLRDFVNRGGGLVLAADPGVDAEAWNRVLGNAGLMPAKLGQLRSESLGQDRFRTLTRSDLGASALQIFETEGAGDLSGSRIYSWFDLFSPRAEAANLVLMDDRSVWAVRSPGMSRGREVLLATGLGGQANNLMVREFFVPLVQQIFMDAAGSGVYPRTVGRGGPIRLWIDQPGQVSGVAFGKQGMDATAMTVQQSGSGAEASVTTAGLESGLYSTLTLRGGDGKRTWFAVQGLRTDSDLTPMSAERVQTLSRKLNLVVANGWADLEQALAKERSGQEGQSWVLMAVLGLLLVELMFLKRFAPEPLRKTAANRTAGIGTPGIKAKKDTVTRKEAQTEVQRA